MSSVNQVKIFIFTLFAQKIAMTHHPIINIFCFTYINFSIDGVFNTINTTSFFVTFFNLHKNKILKLNNFYANIIKIMVVSKKILKVCRLVSERSLFHNKASLLIAQS